jgi:hypothetical protein
MIYNYNNKGSAIVSAPQSDTHLQSRVLFITIIDKQDLQTNPQKNLLRALQQYIISTSWETGLNGDIALYYTNPTKKIKIPHDIASQLQAIEIYASNPDEKTIRKAIISAFKDIPENFFRKKSSASSWIRNFFRPNLTEKYYSKFKPGLRHRNQLITMLKLDIHSDAAKLLEFLHPPE